MLALLPVELSPTPKTKIFAFCVYPPLTAFLALNTLPYAPLRIQNVFLKELKSRDNGKSDSGDANAENINNAFNKVQENRKLARIFRSLS